MYFFVTLDIKPFQLYTFRNQSVVNNLKLVNSMIDMYGVVNEMYNQNSFH